MVTVRGRRRVGKTWLVEEFVERSGAPHVFYAAGRQTDERELGLFAQAIAASTLPSRVLGEGQAFGSWQAALVTAAAGTDRARPSVIVLDELPYLLGATEHARDAVLAAIQSAWDRTLSKIPVLLVLIGSDEAMMELITAPRQPLHQRPSREIVVRPLDPAEAAALSGLSGADALESYLVTGGFPRLVRARMDQSLPDFLADQLADDGTPLVSTGRLVLDGELASSSHARAVLSVIGEGVRKRAAIAIAVGVATTNLKPSLDLLAGEKGIVAGWRPLSTAPSRDTRYAIVDPFLRFYLRFIDRYRGEIERGRGRIVVDRILRDWAVYRGRAIEVLVRDAIDATLPDPRFGAAGVTGAWWADDHSAEVDLVGADRRDPPAGSVAFVGSVKWRERAPLTVADHAALRAVAARIPGVVATTRTVGVSRSGADAAARDLFDVVLGPDDLLGAWPGR